jgi:selenocysteine lyase/cysteine desulfurase
MALGIDVDDGVVRTSMVHYNTHEDVKKLIDALKAI